jgi:magnesium transporter
LVKRFGGDPAVAASPAITTVVDITGLLIYFGTATIFFSL